MKTLLIFSFCFLIVKIDNVCGENQFKIVNLSQGPVKGYKDPNGDLFVFYGIPYATAPTGPFKFKAPMPAPSWTVPLEATRSIVACPPFFNANEDCLIANVYVPNTNATNLPVLVIVHGGGFITGFGDMLRPTSLVNSQKIIAVTFNYRLGVNGFLCLGTNDIPGNAGMKDQVALLRWVRNNIASFGGNPNDVTLSGSSVGSVAVNLITLSPSARGLFHKVIPESGSDLSPFAVQQDPLANAKNFVKTFPNANIDVNNIKALEDFFKKTPLLDLMGHMTYLNNDFSIDFSPCVERKTSEDSFLTDAPINILKSGNYTKVPMLSGFTNMEGLLRIHEFDELSLGMNKNFSNFLPGDLKFVSAGEKEKTANTVKRFYFGDKLVGPETVLNYIEYLSDAAFTVDTLRSIKLRLETGSNEIYLYQFSYVDESTSLIPFSTVRGAGHIAQTEMILDRNTLLINTTQMSPSHMKIKNIMREMWLNFITTGQPVPSSSVDLPSWPPVRRFNSPYMSLTLPVTLNASVIQGRFDFWEQIYDKYYSAPKPPASNSERLASFAILSVLVISLTQILCM